jgi:mannose/cellobiose epimerase-like protein (N-acyl-D-glucosamine 2-epimerase family)
MLFLAAAFLVGCSSANAAGNKSTPIEKSPTHVILTSTSTSVSTLSPTIDTVVGQVLTNMHQHAWNPNAMTHQTVTGGLYINWKMSDPSITNVTNPGADGETDHNHDPQVDLLYLESLAEYHQLHPQDTTYSNDLQRATALVLADFKNYSMPKGWVYFALLKAGTLLQNTALIDTAHSVANNFYRHSYDATLGFVYDRSHHPGVYNSDHTLVAGVALIDAGIRWNTPAWVTAGEKTVEHTIAVALDPQYHLFYYSMVVGNNGHDSVSNYKAKPATQGQIVDSLLTAYTLVHRQQYLDVAKQVLQAIVQTTNMWDTTYGGYYFAFNLGTGTPITAYKETRSQSLILLALHHYDTLIQPQYTVQEQQLVDVLTKHFYDSTYHGYFYRTTTDFRVFVTRQKQGVGTEDYFTTEAMGGAMDALQTTELG